MLKMILEKFEREARHSISIDELNGYYYATMDMLRILLLSQVISNQAYNYLCHRVRVIDAILEYRLFNKVWSLNTMEFAHEL